MKMIGRDNRISKALSENEFNEFVLPHLKKGTRGPSKEISLFKLFNYILKLMHTGCPWEHLIDKNEDGKPEIHFTNIYNPFKFWVKHGCFDKIFKSSAARLFKAGMLNTVIVHGNGLLLQLKKGR